MTMSRRTLITAATAASVGALAGPAAARRSHRATTAAGPPATDTFGIFTDLHTYDHQSARLAIFEKDLPNLPRVRWVSGGDIVNEGTQPGHWTAAHAFRNRLTTATGIGNQLEGPAGNHELMYGYDMGRYATDWCPPEGARTCPSKAPMTDENRQAHRIVWASPRRLPADETSIILEPDQLATLDRLLTADRTRTFIVVHAPAARTLKQTDGTDLPKQFYVQPDADFRALVAKHRHVGAIISGHYHPTLDQDVVTWGRFGDRWVPQIVGHAILNMGDSTEVASLMVNVRKWGFSVWRRRHAAGTWELLEQPAWPPPGRRVSLETGPILYPHDARLGEPRNPPLPVTSANGPIGTGGVRERTPRLDIRPRRGKILSMTTTYQTIENGEAVRISLPGLFADRFNDTQLACDIEADRIDTGHEEYDLAEVWRTRREVKAGKGYRVELEAGLEDLEALLIYAEAFENSASQGDDGYAAEISACRKTIERLTAAIAELKAQD
jgi:hypothetical protein